MERVNQIPVSQLMELEKAKLAVEIKKLELENKKLELTLAESIRSNKIYLIYLSNGLGPNDSFDGNGIVKRPEDEVPSEMPVPEVNSTPGDVNEIK